MRPLRLERRRFVGLLSMHTHNRWEVSKEDVARVFSVVASYRTKAVSTN